MSAYPVAANFGYTHDRYGTQPGGLTRTFGAYRASFAEGRVEGPRIELPEAEVLQVPEEEAFVERALKKMTAGSQQNSKTLPNRRKKGLPDHITVRWSTWTET